MHHHAGAYSSDKKTSFDKRLLKKALSFAGPFWHLLLLSLILMLIFTAADIYRPILEGNGIDQFMQGAVDGTITAREALSGLRNLSIIYLVLIIVQFAVGVVRDFAMRYTSERIIKNIRTDVFNKVQRLPMSFFDKNPAGAIATRITNDPTALNELFTSVILGMMQSAVVMVFVLIIMFKQSLSLTVCLLVVMPIIIAGAAVFQKMARKIFRDIRAKIANVNAFLSEHISGIKIIKAFNIENMKVEQNHEVNEELRKSNSKIIYLFGIFRPLMEFAGNLALAILLYFGTKTIFIRHYNCGTYLYIRKIYEDVFQSAD